MGYVTIKGVLRKREGMQPSIYSAYIDNEMLLYNNAFA